jgi:hypothetical protein
MLRVHAHDFDKLSISRVFFVGLRNCAHGRLCVCMCV